jgi:hypothetical protein
MFEDYYIYAYLDPRKPGLYKYGSIQFEYEPFYIGKGRSKRQFSHIKKYRILNDKNKLKVNKLKKIKAENLDPVIIKIAENIREEKCFYLKKKIISEIGRIDLDTGPLVNLTQGGEGSSGRVCKDETKEKIRNKKLGNKHTEEWKAEHSKKMSGTSNPMYGKSAVKGKRKDLDTRERMSAGQRKISLPIDPIECYTKEGFLIKTYFYRYEMSDDGFKSPGKIIKAAKFNNSISKNRSMYGYIWKYKNK